MAVSPHVISTVRCFLVKMSNVYFNLCFRLDARDAHLIWFSGEPNGVIVEADGKVPCFLNEKDLLGYAASLKLSVETVEPDLHDLDFISSWLKIEKDESVDCKIFLAAWNLFDDVSHSVGGNFDVARKKTNNIYEKLFWGNNLAVITPEGKSYTPIWTKRELKIMREVLSVGLSLFREKTTCV